MCVYIHIYIYIYINALFLSRPAEDGRFPSFVAKIIYAFVSRMPNTRPVHLNPHVESKIDFRSPGKSESYGI